MQHQPAELVALKVAFGLLVRDVGGLEAAHAVTGYPVSRLSEAASLHHRDRWPRVDVVAALEALAPDPRVTATLARLSGHVLLPVPRMAGDHAEALAAVFRKFGDLGARTALALADGKVSDAERGELAEALDNAARAIAHARAVLAGPALPLRRGLTAVA